MGSQRMKGDESRSADQSADSFGISKMCTVFLTAEAWGMLGVTDWNSKSSKPVVCVVEGENVQLFTGAGMLQVRRDRGNVISHCQPEI